MAGKPFDHPFAFGECGDAAEADAYLLVDVESEQAGSNGAVSATPAARVLRIDRIAADCGDSHDRTLALAGCGDVATTTSIDDRR